LNERSPPELDPRLVRRRFDRAAASYTGAAKMEAEVAARMLERLDYVKLAPRRILDAGSGPPGEALERRYPHAGVVSLDFSMEMLKQRKSTWFRRARGVSVCGDLMRLPLPSGCFELAWSNMALHWVVDPLTALKELHRVLVPEGLLMFSSLGPDSLKELRSAAGPARVHAFVDMHDIGDMLVAAGFSAPVMDMEYITVAYQAGGALLEDLRASGQTSARADRARGMAAKAFAGALRAALPSRATFEIVYGHAWKGAPVNDAAKTVRVFKRLP
jgi:malonyl-CoA O-methyltransferase